MLQKLLATLQVKTVPHVGAVKPEVPAGSCLLSSRNGSFGRGDWAVHSFMVIKGRRSVTESHMCFTLQYLWSSLPVAGPEKSSHIAGNAAHSQLFCDSIYGFIAGAASDQEQLRLEGEIFLSDWKIWTWSHQTYLVVKTGFQGSPGVCRRFTSKEETNGRIQARKKSAQMPPTAGTSPCSLSRQC